MVERKLTHKAVLGFALVNPYRRKTLICAGWVEERNPTFSVGLNPTYPKSRLFVQAIANEAGSYD